MYVDLTAFQDWSARPTRQLLCYNFEVLILSQCVVCHSCSESAELEAHAAYVSEQRRQELHLHKGQPPLLRTDREPHNLAHLVTPKGGVATMRLAQVLLAGFCARLPGTDRWGCQGCWIPQQVPKTNNHNESSKAAMDVAEFPQHIASFLNTALGQNSTGASVPAMCPP